jgi:hypothetical protein
MGKSSESVTKLSKTSTSKVSSYQMPLAQIYQTETSRPMHQRMWEITRLGERYRAKY